MSEKISCVEVLSKLYDYLDQEVDTLTEEEIDEHVHACRECFSRMEFERRLRQKVAQSGSVAAPEDVQKRLTSLIKRF